MLELIYIGAMPSTALMIHLLTLLIGGLLVVYAGWLAHHKNFLTNMWVLGSAALLIGVNLFISWLLPTPTADGSPGASGVVWYNSAFRADFGLGMLVLALVVGVGWWMSALHRPADRVWQAGGGQQGAYWRTSITALFALTPIIIWLWAMLFWGGWAMPFFVGAGIALLAGIITSVTDGTRRSLFLLLLAGVVGMTQWRVNLHLIANAESMFDPTGAVPYIIPLISVVVGALLAALLKGDINARAYTGLTVRLGAVLWLMVLVGFIIRFMGHYDYEGTYGFYLGALLELPLRLMLSLTRFYYAVIPREIAAEANLTSVHVWNAAIIALFTVLSGVILVLSLRRQPARRTRPDAIHLTLRQRRYVLAIILVLPALLLRLFTTLYPFAQTSLLSLQRYNPAFPPQEYVGLRNFVRLSNDLVVRESLEFTLMFVFVSTFFQLVLGLAVAHLLNAKFSLRGAGRTISLIPWAIPMVVAAIGFRWMFDEDFGMIPDLIMRLTGLETSWLINPQNAKIAVVIVNIWKSTPFVALILLAGLQGIGEDLYEAARVDGSTVWQSLWYITLPMLMPIIVSTTMYMLVWQLAVFDLTFAMTGGGPGFATTLFAQKIYVEINSLNYSFAAALSMVLVVIVTIIGTIGLYTFRRVEVAT